MTSVSYFSAIGFLPLLEASGFSATIGDLLLRTLGCSGAAKAKPASVTAATMLKAQKTSLARADDFFVVFPV
jgi:hypothetical protein